MKTRLYMVGAVLGVVALFWVLGGVDLSRPPTPVRDIGWGAYSEKYLHEAISVTDGFDFPLGPPDGVGAYLQRGFRERGCLGEEWQFEPGRAGGAAVCAAGDGVVILADDFGAVWGKVVIVLHRLPRNSGAEWVETLYANLSELNVKPGVVVKRGDVVGRLEVSEKALPLHFEIRISPGHGLGPGETNQMVQDWVQPSLFIRKHRP